jgi:multiple sugar transport system ATP-binding protein
MPGIELENLTKVYAGGVTALAGLNLDVADGEFTVLVGPSGCGKTTALRMVAGLEKITSGTVSFGGKVVNDVSPRRRDLAMVFQNYALYPHMTVYDNIGFAMENQGVPKSERDRRIRSAAEMLGLTSMLGRKPRQLSGGQRQRVAMGRALVREPSVFLMDEPLSNLDAKLRTRMRAEVLRVHKEIGAATLYVTHDQVEAMTMGDRIAVLNLGVLQQYATPGDLYGKPANLFVARFIGSPEMNLYEAQVDPAGAVVLGSQRLPLEHVPAGVSAALSAGGAQAGGTVIVGIRPEDLTLAGAEDPGTLDATGTLSGDVRMVEQQGTELHAFFTMDAKPAGSAGSDTSSADTSSAGAMPDAGLLGQSFNGVARLDPRCGVRPGTRITFRVDPGRLYYFAADTGAALAWPADAVVGAMG